MAPQEGSGPGYRMLITTNHRYSPTYYGRTWLDDLQCTSSDVMLSTCQHSGFGTEDCQYYEDVAVSCTSSATSDNSSVTSDTSFASSGKWSNIIP